MTTITVDPIVVLGVPRSGRSMVMDIFAAHKVWQIPHAYNALSAYAEINENFSKFGSIKNDKQRGGIRRDIESIVQGYEYAEGPWMVKHAPGFWRMYTGWPDPTFVVVMRDRDELEQIWIREGMNPEEIDTYLLDVYSIRGKHQVVFVEEIQKGLFGRLRSAFDKAGLQFDDDIARRVIG